METPSPFSFLADGLDRLASKLPVPAWLSDEMQHRLVLFLNHVLMAEPQAQTRLASQQGRVLRLQWRHLSMQLAATPAGLWELAPTAEHDLRLSVADDSPLVLARQLASGSRPAVRIEGDSQFAAEVNWLVEHLRWDVEEDLARLLGDAPAHTLASVGRQLASGLRQFVARTPGFDAGAGHP